MKCAWQSFINLLPIWMRDSVDKQGRTDLQELRLRINMPPELVRAQGNCSLDRIITGEDIKFCINLASRYSPWAAATIANGFITAPGGHRIGLCGSSVIKDMQLSTIHNVSSLCIRVARDFPGIAKNAGELGGSILIIGKPGSGKTTLLRDLIRYRSNNLNGSVAVVDERQEIFPLVHNQFAFPIGKHTDVLSGCMKPQGIEAVLRNMGPDTIAVDEITAPEDCEALVQAGWCGVRLIATAHAGSAADLYNRPVYRPIINSNLFDTLLIMHSDKSWRKERMQHVR